MMDHLITYQKSSWNKKNDNDASKKNLWVK